MQVKRYCIIFFTPTVKPKSIFEPNVVVETLVSPEVDELIQSGWQPQGGIAFDPNTGQFYQAMVHPDQEEEQGHYY